MNDLKLYIKNVEFEADGKKIAYEQLYTVIVINGENVEIELSVRDKFAKTLLKNIIKKGGQEHV